MAKPHRWRNAVLLLIAQGTSISTVAVAQTPPSAPPDQEQATTEQKRTKTEPIREVGGRLVVTSETVIVTANPDLPPRDSSIATKSDTPLAETPRSISVVTRQTLDDRVAINVADSHDYATGMMPADDRGPAFARGFRVGFYDVRRDGLRTYAWSIREPVGVEMVQYLRGPAAILYGDGSPGGLVNLVLKKPLPVRLSQFTAAAGESGFSRLTGDVTGPVAGTRRWRYRLIGAAEWLDNGIENRERRLSFLPMLSIDVANNVTLHLDGELYHQRGRNYWHFVPATAETQRGDFSRIPWDLNTASPDDSWSGWNVSPGLRLDAQLGGSTSLHISSRYTKIGGDLDIQGLLDLAADGRTLRRYAYREISTWHEYQSDAFVASKLTTGPFKHVLVAGVEAGLSTTDSQIGVGAAPTLDMINPVYAPRPVPPALRPTRYDITRAGIYVQDQFRLNSVVTVVPGLRWSRLGTENRVATAVSSSSSPADLTSSETAVSPSVGVIVFPRRDLSLYATAARGFEPPTPGQYLEDGRGVKPADSAMIEGGVKSQLADGRLTVTGAAFHIRRTNVPEADVRGFFRQIGEGRSNGLETEIAGSVSRGLMIQGSYAWTRATVTEDLTGFVGMDLPNAPRHNASLWVRYRFTSGAFDRLMVSGGVLHVSNRFTAASNTTIVPAYSRLDASGSYEVKGQRLKVSLAVQNLTNTRYATSGSGGVLYAGSPRRAVVQFSSSF